MPKNILDEIIANKKKEVAARKSVIPLDKLQESLGVSEEDDIFISVLTEPKAGDIALIAEIKLTAPSVGVLGEENEVVPKAIEYEQAGADALSVVTDKKYFNGEVEFITRVKRNVSLPLLQKDFVVDEYQIYEAKKAGADGLLLIARILEPDILTSYQETAKSLGLQPIVEVFNEQDIEKAVAAGATAIGVNARDLDTFETDIERACKLIGEMPQEVLRLGFSGVASRADVEQYLQAGAKAVLVGTSLMRAESLPDFISKLKGVEI